MRLTRSYKELLASHYTACHVPRDVDFRVLDRFERCAFCSAVYWRWTSDAPPPGFCSGACHDAARAKRAGAAS